MTWWAWVLVWVVLVVLAAAVLWFTARRVLRQGAALARELGEAADRLSAISAGLDDAAPAATTTAPTPGGRSSSARGSRALLRRGAGSQDVR